MTTSHQRGNFFRFLLGSLFILAGVVALGNNIGWWQIDDLFLDWWPMILILLGLISIFSPGASNVGGVILLFLGTAFLLQSRGYFYIEDLIWPGILILIGIVIFTPKKNNTQIYHGGADSNEQDEKSFDINVLFHNGHHIITSKTLAGGQASSVFGNLDLDLSQAVPAGSTHITVSAVFGKATVHVPAGWRIKKTGGSAFGGVQDLRVQRDTDVSGPSVTLEMSAVFGSVELKN